VTWTLLTQVSLTNSFAFLPVSDAGQTTAFYRAVEVSPGSQPTLQARLNPDGTRQLLLTGTPGSSYYLQTAASLSAPVAWTTLERVPLVGSSIALPVASSGAPSAFYRAVEFFADPPVLEATLAADGSRQLLLYGRPGQNYTIQSVSSLSSPVTWTMFTQVSLVNSFAFVPVPEGLNSAFYRVGEGSPGGQPTLEALLNPDGTRQLLLTGTPGSSYYLQTAASLSAPVAWTTLERVPLVGSSLSLPLAPVGTTSTFYRAVEFFADPPVAESLLNPDQTRTLLIYGLPAHEYAVEYSASLSNVVTWHPLLNLTLTNSFRYQAVGNTNRVIFYRLLRKN
jgi:hypothetical protein